MGHNFNITPDERNYLRELAKKQIEYAGLPVMTQRTKLWYEHNSLKGERPVIVMETDGFVDEIIPELECENSAAREIERNLLISIINHELIDDDKVIPPYYTVYWKIDISQFGIEIPKEYAEDSKRRKLGYTWKHPIKDLKRDLSLLMPSTYSVDREYTMAWKTFVEEIIGDILPVKIKNNSLFWSAAPSMKVVDLMGLEQMMFALADYPEEVHLLYKFLRDDIVKFIRWQEEQGLLVLNNENDYAGAGSYGFTKELPTENYSKTGQITARDLWGNLNSQETVGISPVMYEEFIFPYYRDLSEEFGLVYYGCCEPVHDLWKDYLSKLPNLRKISISAWCNEEFMGEALRGSGVIYSRKPRPNFVGVGSFDEEAYTAHILKTLNAAEGCHTELIFRDVYTLSGDIRKPGTAVAIARRLIDRVW